MISDCCCLLIFLFSLLLDTKTMTFAVVFMFFVFRLCHSYEWKKMTTIWSSSSSPPPLTFVSLRQKDNGIEPSSSFFCVGLHRSYEKQKTMMIYDYCHLHLLLFSLLLDTKDDGRRYVNKRFSSIFLFKKKKKMTVIANYRHFLLSCCCCKEGNGNLPLPFFCWCSCKESNDNWPSPFFLLVLLQRRRRQQVVAFSFFLLFICRYFVVKFFFFFVWKKRFSSLVPLLRRRLVH